MPSLHAPLAGGAIAHTVEQPCRGGNAGRTGACQAPAPVLYDGGNEMAYPEPSHRHPPCMAVERAARRRIERRRRLVRLEARGVQTVGAGLCFLGMAFILGVAVLLQAFGMHPR